jgi:hypothetical protein
MDVGIADDIGHRTIAGHLGVLEHRRELLRRVMKVHSLVRTLRGGMEQADMAAAQHQIVAQRNSCQPGQALRRELISPPDHLLRTVVGDETEEVIPVPSHIRLAHLAATVHRFFTTRALPRRVAEIDDPFDPPMSDIGEDGVKRRHVAVHV